MGPTWLELKLARLDENEDDARYDRAEELLASSPDAQRWRSLFDRVGLISGAALLIAGVMYVVAFNWDALGPWSKLSMAAGGLALCGLGGLVYGNRSLSGSVALAAGGVMAGPLLIIHSQAYQTGADAWSLFAWWLALFVPWAVVSRLSGIWLGALALLETTLATFIDQHGGGLDAQMLAMGAVAVLWWVLWALKNPPSVYPKLAATVGWLGLLGASLADLVGDERMLGIASLMLLAVVGATLVRSSRTGDLFLISGAGSALIAWLSSRLLYLLVTANADWVLVTFVMGLAILGQAFALGAWIRAARGGHDALDA